MIHAISGFNQNVRFTVDGLIGGTLDRFAHKGQRSCPNDEEQTISE